MTIRLDPDEIGKTLADIGDKLFSDVRTVSLALKLDDLRRDIALALVEIDSVQRRVNPGLGELARRAKLAVPACETGRQAREQGASDGLRVRGLESSVSVHGGRFVEVLAQ